MYIIVDKDKIVTALNKYSTTYEEVVKEYPGLRIIEKGTLGIPPANIKELTRVYNGDVVDKVRVKIETDKESIDGDGDDEIKISVTLENLQEDEHYDKVILDVGGATIPVEIESNKGSVVVSSKSEGLSVIDVKKPEGVVCLKRGFFVK